MGYRLGVTQIGGKLDFYGSKLYGYGANFNNSKSLKFLLDNDYLHYKKVFNNYALDEFWHYGGDGNIVMFVSDFRQFIKLYNEDCNNLWEVKETDKDYDWIIKNKDIIALCNLQDYGQVLLDWG